MLYPFMRNGANIHEQKLNSPFMYQYAFSKPEREDVVVIRLAGKKVMLLKRVVAQDGDMVEFRKGKLYVNGKNVVEAYVRYPSDWNLPPRRVDNNHVYVVGDNRNVSIDMHRFGQTSIDRIIGAPLWKK